MTDNIESQLARLSDIIEEHGKLRSVCMIANRVAASGRLSDSMGAKDHRFDAIMTMTADILDEIAAAEKKARETV